MQALTGDLYSLVSHKTIRTDFDLKRIENKAIGFMGRQSRVIRTARSRICSKKRKYSPENDSKEENFNKC